MLAKTGVHHYSGNNIELGTACGRYYRVCTLSITDPGKQKLVYHHTIQDSSVKLYQSTIISDLAWKLIAKIGFRLVTLLHNNVIMQNIFCIFKLKFNSESDDFFPSGSF